MGGIGIRLPTPGAWGRGRFLLPHTNESQTQGRKWQPTSQAGSPRQEIYNLVVETDIK